LGYPDQGARRSQEALALAHKLGHPFSLTDVLAFAGCLFHGFSRDVERFSACADEMVELATDQVTGWLGSATWYRGEALAMLGDFEAGIAGMREGLERQGFSVERCYRTGCLGALAAAQGKADQVEAALATVADAFRHVDESEERYYEAELWRVQGDLLLTKGLEDSAEASFKTAIDVAHRQQAKSWELRATTSLCRLWLSQGKNREARHALSEIYGWFTEGFDTPDLKDAEALLEALG
jgi:adenylate cyclase